MKPKIQAVHTGFCKKCGGVGPFGKDAKFVDGLNRWCKKCVSVSALAWNQANPEKFKKNKAKYYKNNREKHYLRSRKWARGNQEKMRCVVREWYRRNVKKNNERVRRWSAANPERVKLFRAQYRKRNPEKVRLKDAKRRARFRNANGDATVAQIEARVAFFGGCCAYCGGLFENLDHVIPLAKGGTNWPANFRPACQKCNFRKGARTWHEARI